MKSVKKTLFLGVILILTSIFLAGCTTKQSARLDFDITIKRNQKVDISVLCAVLQEMVTDEFLSTEDLRDMKSRGWEYKLYNQDEYLGYVFTMTDQRLADVVHSAESMEPSLGGIDIENFSISQDGMTYTFRAQLFDDDDAEYLSLFRTDFLENDGYVRVTLHLPEKATSSNASFVSDDGKTLTWDLLNMGANQQMYAEFRIIPQYYIYIMIGIAVIVPILLIISTAIRVSRKKKEAKIAAAQAAARKKAEALAAAETQKKAASVAQAKKRALAAAQAAANRKATPNTVSKKPNT
ncbi:LppM family (lipo)protein [Butyrivibrio hungatei]|uniref:LppM domain-containing protein n=1 Tax=Butyrivibrio hungatei TaxID=185008 RepID=A0A1D9NYR9_9FIRM|nr:hypothetical protein [Butyrivibrio hungatei]AOZ95341.1 hypothetical protein bhn_I0307 [Butyrivibrio hungatei]